MNLHALLGELGSHGDKISCDLNRVLECHAWIIMARTQTPILYAQLPDHRS